MPDEPNILVPWELFAGIHPDSLNCRQGFEEFWLYEIWYPYWQSLTDDERSRLLAAAPTSAWKDWLEWRAEGAARVCPAGENRDFHSHADACRRAYKHFGQPASPPQKRIRQRAAALAALLHACLNKIFPSRGH